MTMMQTPLTLPAPPATRNIAREAFEVLNYNQQLVQFADTKAGTLILVNSLFMAAAGASPAGSSEMQTLRGLSMLVAAAAVVASLLVVTTRLQAGEGSNRADLVFFDSIARRPNAEYFVSEFLRGSADVQVYDVLTRAYTVARIAKRKFESFELAQMITVGSGGLWLLTSLSSLM